MKKDLPLNIYHLVPIHVYEKSINRKGNYNCRGFENSNFIHTTSNLKELKKVADILFTKSIKPNNTKLAGKFYEPPTVKFLLLKINPKKVTARIGFVKPCYYHIYGSIQKKAYTVKNIKRDKQGRFFL
jgi:hypothetical protein